MGNGSGAEQGTGEKPEAMEQDRGFSRHPEDLYSGDSWGAAEDNGIPLLVEVLLTDLGRYNLYIMKFTPVKCLTWWL